MNVVMASKKMIYLVSIILLLGVTSACQEQLDTAEKTEIVRPANIVEVISFQGLKIRTFPASIEASKKTDLAFRVAGQLIQLPVRAGTEVKQGQLLAQIDSSDYQNALDDRVAKLNLVQVQHKQIHTLFKKSYASQAEIDSIDALLKAAQVAVQQAQTNVKYTNLRAPFSGVIAKVNVENYQYIQPQQSIVQLQNTSQLEVHFDVPESMIKSSRQTGDYKSLCGIVKLDDGSNSVKEFKACYKEHDSVPDIQTRTYPVIFSMDNPEESMLLPGMSVDFVLDHSSIALSNDLNGLLIPVESVFDENNQQWVWKVGDDMRVVKTLVVVAGIDKDMIRITKGLIAGDKIIANGVTYLTEGQKIRPFYKERGL